MTTDRLKRAVDAIDRANREDPNLETANGQKYPKEWLYGERMSQWLLRLRPEPSDLQQLAARGQHIFRWKIPRSEYPQTRECYLRWRKQLYRYHGDRVVEIMAAEGYDTDSMDQVKRMIGKQGIKRDHDVQLIEDTACLVFLEFYLQPFAAGQPEEKLIDIIRKTWDKMSDVARGHALKIDYPAPIASVLGIALQAGD